jgi:hypothetical protein
MNQQNEAEIIANYHLVSSQEKKKHQTYVIYIYIYNSGKEVVSGDLLSRDRDLVSFLLRLLTDEAHHLLNLL